MNENEHKPSEPTNELLKQYSKPQKQFTGNKKRKDLLDGFVWRNSFEVYLTPYTKMVLTLYESSSKSGMFRVEQKIGYNRVVYDGNLVAVIAETLKELGRPFVPVELKPKEGLTKEGSS